MKTAASKRFWLSMTLAGTLAAGFVFSGGGLSLTAMAAEETAADSVESEKDAEKTIYPGGSWEPGEAEYGVSEEVQYWIMADDDTKLYASAFYPTDLTTDEQADGEFPVFIEFTPYGFEGQEMVPNSYLVEHGYIYLIVRCRGTGRKTQDTGLYVRKGILGG